MLVNVSLKLIYLYRLIAPRRFRDSCLFEPTCSEYAILALNKYGFFTGWVLALRRIGRCKHPNGGVDQL
ncbi:membrane protein insertion efficiency factor YidD [Vibrio sp. ZSDE26]|uniref:Membrane protein insertion efficiency factor YidD n=1 Tax=Vibrio amylolyticus TaxID=2847292 RepID=A0A9X2BJZ8_9VIBR|nr:membrane protein insertion efficiency factor YidD [Vibrio amylolyticus]